MILQNIRQKFRLRMLALLVGVYNLNNEAKKLLIHEERLVSATEIIYFSESLYLAAFIILVMTISVISLGIFNSTLFIPFIMITTLLALLFIGVVYSATRVEMIFLTSERVVIRYLSILEKILRVKRELSLSIDQISIISYGRAPFNRGALGLALLGTLTVSLMMFILANGLIDPFLVQMTVILISILVILIVLRLILFGLRLTRGVLELQTVGLTTPVQIGLDKGVPRSFIQEVHLAVLERVHHTLHHEDQEDIDIVEFPLESSKTLKNAFNQVKTSNEKKNLKLLDQNLLRPKNCVETSPNFLMRKLMKFSPFYRKKI